MIDRGLYGNILKDWTLGECYDEAKVDYWNFEVPNHVDLENFGTVDDSHFFSNLVDQLSTPLKENPVSQDQKENSRPISRAFRKSSEEKINFIKLSQENKLKANVDFTELSLFNSRKNRMSERARRRSRQITIEEEKLQKNASNGVNPRFDDGIIPKLNIFTKENGSVGSISLFSNSNIKEKPARNPLRPISYMKEDELTRSTACANDINTKDQVVRNVSRRISFSKENEPVGWASRLSNRNPKDQVSRNPSRQNSFTMKINPLGLTAHVNDINKKDQVRSIFRSGSFTKKTEPTRPITCQRSITMKETRTGNLPTQDPTTRERFIFSRREAQKAVNKEVSLSTRLLRRLSASKPSERKSENEQTEKNKFVNSVRDSCNVGNEHAMKDEKSTKVPGFFRETQSSVLRAAKNRSSIDTVPSGIPRILNRQMSADGIPSRRIFLAETLKEKSSAGGTLTEKCFPVVSSKQKNRDEVPSRRIFRAETLKEKSSLVKPSSRKISLPAWASNIIGLKKRTNDLKEKSAGQTAQKKIEPLTRASTFDKMLRAYDPPTGSTPKKTLTLPFPFRIRRSTSRCRDGHPSIPPPMSQTPGRMSANSSAMDPQERQELIRACVERLSSPKNLRYKGNASATSNFTSSRGSRDSRSMFKMD